MNILCAIKVRGAAWTNAVRAEDLDRLFLERFVTNKVVKVVGGEIGNHAAG